MKLSDASILLSVGVYKGNKKRKKSKLPFTISNIMMVEDSAQNKLLDSIQEFAKKKVMVDIKRKSSFNLARLLVIAKYIAILGAIGLIGYYIGNIITNIIQWCDHINEKYNVLDNLNELYTEFKNSGSNIFIFIHQNWDEKFNLKQKIYTIIHDSVVWVRDTIIKWVNAAWEFINIGYDVVEEWFNNVLSDNSEYQLDVDAWDDSQIAVRSPYDPNKMYKITDPEVVSATDVVVNPHEAEDSKEVDDSEVDMVESDNPPSQGNIDKPNGKSSIWKNKDKLKEIITELGEGDGFNKTIGQGSEDGEKQAEKERELLKQQKLEHSNSSQTNINKTEKIIPSNNLTPTFDSTQISKDIETLLNIKTKISNIFDYDEQIIQTVHYALENIHT